MAHHIYTTDAYVIESFVSGEADRFFTLFTRDLGVVRATARGVRLQKSKLRPSLQELSRSRVSLVRGKEVWRLTSARVQENFYALYRHDKKILEAVANIATLIRRLVGGEEKNEALFDMVSDAYAFLASREWHDASELKNFETILVLRILNNLGYLARVAELERFLEGGWGEGLIAEMEPCRALAVREINMSLRETQL